MPTLSALTRIHATAAILLYAAVVPSALSSDEPQPDETKVSTTLEAGVDKLEPAGKTDLSDANVDEKAAVPVVYSKVLATGKEEWVCRRETPTGSRRAIEVCRRTEDIDASVTEVERTMHRRSQYGNPSITPDG